MLKIPYKIMNLKLCVEFFDGKFYFSRLPDEKNIERVAKARESPEAYKVKKSKQGIKLESYLLSGMSY
jgi:hypothetical protein